MNSSLPLVDALLKAGPALGFHMPGHDRGRAFPEELKTLFSSFDTTERAGLDDLNRPQGPARQAMERAAQVFGAAVTRFVTAGSTVSLLAALTTFLPFGGRLVLPRAVHRSIVHAAALLNAELVFFPVEDEDGWLPRPRALLPGLEAADVVLVTSPDYQGRLLDLGPFRRLADRLGARLIVDEAHGAHLVGLPQLAPYTALAQGADVAVQSAHKTLPALTGASLLHLGSRAAAAEERLASVLPIFQTSSPSFPIAASLDYAVDWLAREGRATLQRQAAFVSSLEERLPPGIHRLQGRLQDPLRLVLDLRELGLSGREAADWLLLQGVEGELVTPLGLILIVAPAQPQAELEELLIRLAALPRGREAASGLELESALAQSLAGPGERVLSPHEALFGRREHEACRLDQAAGRIAGCSLAPSPPCLPLIWPGERLKPADIELLSRFWGDQATRVDVLSEA